jgi:hypothetical protein
VGGFDRPYFGTYDPHVGRLLWERVGGWQYGLVSRISG